MHAMREIKPTIPLEYLGVDENLPQEQWEEAAAEAIGKRDALFRANGIAGGKD